MKNPFQPQGYPEDNDPQKTANTAQNPGPQYGYSQRQYRSDPGRDFRGASSGPDKKDNCLFALVVLLGGTVGLGLVGTKAYQQLSAKYLNHSPVIVRELPSQETTTNSPTVKQAKMPKPESFQLTPINEQPVVEFTR